MRILLLLRGAPGVGKSTWIKEHGLQDYTLSADSIRLLCQSPVLDVDGKPCIGTAHEKFVWKTLFEILEFRLDRGEFTVIDATNSKTAEMTRYKEICAKYRYRMYCVDMTTVPIEECKRRNKLRDPLRQVPETSIDKCYSRFATQKIPSGITVINPDDLDSIFVKKFDLNQYTRIHHIGDVHGCATALKQYIDSVGGIKDDEMWIFTGDYIDRGIENVETLKYLISIKDKRNVLLLVGNHDQRLASYLTGEKTNGREFELITRQEIDQSDIDHKDLRQLVRKFGQVAYYDYDGKTVLVNHAGVSNIPDQISFIPTIQFIRGVGDYNDFETIAQNFDKNTSENTYQIFGHRNTKDSPIEISERCFNLEGKVEFGGYLRVVQLDKDGFHPVYIKNNVYRTQEENNAEVLLNSDIADVILSLRKNRYIQEKQFGYISSFNFTRDAFMKDKWDRETVKARGLYINTEKGYVVARGYEKFFKVNEMDDTKIERLQQKLKFPVDIYKKENGYLGLISYNPETDDFFITTKSNPIGDYADWLKDKFYNLPFMNDNRKESLKELLKSEKLTLLFEVVDMVKDPHIIDYDQNHLFLLDAVYNEMNFRKIPYSRLCNLAEFYGFEVKTKVTSIATWQEFFDFYMENNNETEETAAKDIEGYVIEDANGYMVKLKNQYYNFWKGMRGLSHEVLRRGYTNRTGSLTTALSNTYYGWLKDLFERTPKEARDSLPKDIITLRKQFLEYHPEYK